MLNGRGWAVGLFSQQRQLADKFVAPIKNPASHMPDPKTLKVGDRIQILSVPVNDLRRRERELAEKTEMAGWTADSIERIIEQSPIVSVTRVDEYGCVWYDATVVGPDGIEEEHSLIVYDDDTWERLDPFRE